MTDESTTHEPQNRPLATKSAAHLTTCAATLQATARRLDTDSVTGLDRVVTAAQAGEIINHMAGRDAPCGPEAGTEAARRLVGFYPAREVNDAKSYVAGMSALLASAPLDFVRRVVDPVHGLPTRLKWLPTLADVREALNAEKARRERIWANARWIISQAEERERKAREAAEYEANRPDLEARRKIVESALKPFPTPHKAA